ncbi:hypothetical protein [Actinomadura sp. SCN-SB]|uniref:hypothetical protein n=1 Tax=Actinomadura sp. SCN-SB TaxID=3373092 RepID=UPI00375219B7
MTPRTRQQVTLPITPALLRATAAHWTALAAEQQRIYHLGTGRTDNPGLWHDIALTAQGRARQLEDCAADLMALAQDLETACNPE